MTLTNCLPQPLPLTKNPSHSPLIAHTHPNPIPLIPLPIDKDSNCYFWVKHTLIAYVKKA